MDFFKKLAKGFKKASSKDKAWAIVCFALCIGLAIYFFTLL